MNSSKKTKELISQRECESETHHLPQVWRCHCLLVCGAEMQESSDD